MANKIYQAMWKNRILAESDACILVEGNVYFPRHSIHSDCFRPNETHTYCHWKGEAGYFDIVVDGEVNRNAAWYYPEPEKAAGHIRNCVAFWNGVSIIELPV